MKTVSISIVTAALLLGNAASQDVATTTPSSARAAPQTSTPPQGSAPEVHLNLGPIRARGHLRELLRVVFCRLL